MDEGRFETYVRECRDNLEMLLFGKEPLYKKISNSLLNLKNQLEEFDKDSKEKGCFGSFIQIRGVSIKIPFFISLRIFGFLSRTSGRCICYHEIGELIYSIPFFSVLYKDPNKEMEINVSEITASDVFGDLLASTFSSLTPKQQLELLKNKNIDDFISLPLKDYMFIVFQLDTLEKYETRKEVGYVYGPELKDFYRQILELQLGFNDVERKNFQLKLYDTAQRQIGERLREYNQISEENLAKIFFNADSLISELKS